MGRGGSAKGGAPAKNPGPGPGGAGAGLAPGCEVGVAGAAPGGGGPLAAFVSTPPPAGTLPTAGGIDVGPDDPVEPRPDDVPPPVLVTGEVTGGVVVVPGE